MMGRSLLQATGGSEYVPMDGEPGEDEAGQGDQGEFDLGDAAESGAEPDAETGKDGKEAEKYSNGGGGVYQVQGLVPGLRGRCEVVAGCGEEAEDAAKEK